MGLPSALLLRRTVPLQPHPSSVSFCLLSFSDSYYTAKSRQRFTWRTESPESAIHVVVQHFRTRASKWTGEKGKEDCEFQSSVRTHLCGRWRNAPSLTPLLQNICTGAREQGGLLEALMAFHPPQVSRNSCNMLGGSFQTAPPMLQKYIEHIIKAFLKIIEVLSLSGGKQDHKVKKLLPCPLFSVEAQGRHSIVCGVNRLWIICIQTDELCNPA